MTDDTELLQILVFAAIAFLILLRLWGVLGRRTGHQKPHDPFAPPAEHRPSSRRPVEPDYGPGDLAREGGLSGRRKESANLSPAEMEARWRPYLLEDKGALLTAIRSIRTADPSFEPAVFAEGAKAAFEMILQAFSESKEEVLKPLLTKEVFADFSKAIAERRRLGQRLDTTLIGIKNALIAGAELRGRHAFVTVEFQSDQINVMRDENGEMLEGETSAVLAVVDVWTFCRDTKSPDPNWQLAATRNPGT